MGQRHLHARRGSELTGQRLAAQEILPLTLVLLVLTMELVHVAHSSWLSLFLYNGDSLTLPLFREAIAQHQPWLPIVSTQLLIFPEGVIYAVCSAVTSSIRASLVLNAYANLLLIYAATRLLASGVVARPYASRVCDGCGVRQPDRADAARGPDCRSQPPIRHAASSHDLLLRARPRRHRRPRRDGRQIHAGDASPQAWRWVAIAAAVSTLTYFSNPLFLLWVSTPLVVTALGLGLLHRLPLRQVAMIAGCQATSLLAGTLLRRPFASAIGSSASSYVKFGRLGAAGVGLSRDAATDVVATRPNVSS